MRKTGISPKTEKKPFGALRFFGKAIAFPLRPCYNRDYCILKSDVLSRKETDMILPIVKCDTLCGTAHPIPTHITYTYESGNASARLGAEAFASFSDATAADSDAFVRFGLDEGLEDRAEIYRVTVSCDHITVGFRDARGAVNGAATVALLLRKEDLREGEILDYPSCDYRSLMIDMARGLPKEEDVLNVVKYMALAKYNRLHLHLSDSEGPCYRSEVHPEYRFLGKGEDCDKELLRRIDALCRTYAIEIIPEIEIPAHASALCKAHPEFKCQVENADPWALCPGNEDVYPFFDALIREVVALFPDSRYLHIGTDELEFTDLKPPYLCHWEECPRCAALREREGLKDKREEFYYVVNRVHEIVRKYGKRMILWNDQIDVSKDVPISRDILVQFWRIAGKGRGPREGCTFERFLELGFEVVNAYYPETYFDLEDYMTEEKMKTWTPFRIPEQDAKYAKQILGGEACAWEFGNYEEYPFYGYVTPPVAAIFSDKLWGLGERSFDAAYRQALAEFVFGDASLAQIFDCIGGLIPPRKRARFTYLAPEDLHPDVLHAMQARLDTCTHCPSLEAYRLLLARIAETATGHPQ